MKKLDKTSEAELQKQRSHACDVITALDEDLPIEIIEALNWLGDKSNIGYLKAVLKVAGIDCTEFVAAAAEAVKQWKMLQNPIAKTLAAAIKLEKKLDKQRSS